MSAWTELEHEPFAEVERLGRCYHRVRIIDGITSYGPDGCGWRVLGRRRAERKAERELARYMVRLRRGRDVIRIPSAQRSAEGAHINEEQTND